MKMCHISAVPRPSNSSTPNVRFQRWYSSTGSGSPADVASRRHERSCLAAAEWLTIWLIIVGTLIMTVGRKRAIFPKRTSGVAASGNNTVPAPTENGNKRFERSEEHTSELQSRLHLVCRLLLEKKQA